MCEKFVSIGEKMVQYLQPKPTEEEAAKVKCPVCKNTAHLSQVGSHNGNKGRWYYGCCKFIKFADGLMSRKDKAPLQEPPTNTQPSAMEAPTPSVSMYGSAGLSQTINLSQTPAVFSQADAAGNSCFIPAGLSQSPQFNSELQGTQQPSQVSSTVNPSQERLQRRQAQTAQLRMTHSTHTAPVMPPSHGASAAAGVNQAGPSCAPCQGPSTQNPTALGAHNLVSPSAAPSTAHESFSTPQCTPPAAALDAERALLDSMYVVTQNMPSRAPPGGLPSQTNCVQQLGFSQMSQDSSSQAWASCQNPQNPNSTRAWQNNATAFPVGLQSPTPTQAPIMVSPPKSPAGSLAARAAAVSQAIQGSPLAAMQLNGSQSTAMKTPVRPRSPSEDLDALFDVLESPAVKQKVARVQAEKQACEANTQQTPPANDKPDSSDDEALFNVLESPEVVRKIQQCALRSGAIHDKPDAAERSPNAMSMGGAALSQSLGGGLPQLQSTDLQPGVEERPADANGVGVNSQDPVAHESQGGMDHQREKPSETQGLHPQTDVPGGPSSQGVGEAAACRNRSPHATGLVTSAVPKQHTSNSVPDGDAEHGDWMDVDVAAESDEDDVVVVHTQSATHPAFRATSQVLDLC